MIALFASFSETIWIHNLVRVRQISRSLQDVAVLCNPVGLFVLLGRLVLARVLKIRVTLEVMLSNMRLFLFIFLLGQLGVQKSDFIVVGLEENGVLKEGSHVHGSLISYVIVAGGARFVGADVGRASEWHTVMLLFLLSGRLFILLGAAFL